MGPRNARKTGVGELSENIDIFVSSRSMYSCEGWNAKALESKESYGVIVIVNNVKILGL